MGLLAYIRFLFDLIIDGIFRLFSRRETYLPKPKYDFLSESAMSLAHKVRTKELSSETIVRACIERLKEVNGLLNAVIDERYDEAIKEAIDVDEYLKTCTLSTEQLGKEKPFLGLPFTSKESTAVKGLSFTFGSVARIGCKAEEDAEIVRLMKKAGAICIAVTNVPEFNLWCETRNMIFGQTLNPYNFNKTVGGSSGGEGCVVSVCGSPLGLGTDIGGSTRMPAYFCGLFGHKATGGVINTRGMTFRDGNEGQTMVSAGPIVRHSEDLIPFTKVILKEESIPLLKLDEKVTIEDLEVFYVLEPGDITVSPVSNEVKNAIIKAANHLAKITKKPAKEINLPGFHYCKSLWRHGMTKEKGDFAFDISNRKCRTSLKNEIPKLLAAKCKHSLPAIMRLIDLDVMPKTNVDWAEKTQKQLLEELDGLLGKNGVLLFPSHPSTAPYHYASFFRPYNFAYWGIFNALYLPATQVPMGLDSQGMPLGFQVISAPYNDRLTFAVAATLEQEFGGWVPPYNTDIN